MKAIQLAFLVRLMMAQASTHTMSMMLLLPFLAKSSCCSLFVRKGKRIVTDWLLSISPRLSSEALCSAKS